MKRHCFLLALVGTLIASAVYAQEPAIGTPTEPAAKTQSGQNVGVSVQVCFSGLHGGKVIVSEGKVADEAVETTAKACGINGGAEARVPLSPIIPAGSAAIA